MATKTKRYGLRIRDTDEDKWEEPEYYATKKERDEVEIWARVFCRYRTHSFEGKLKPATDGKLN